MTSISKILKRISIFLYLSLEKRYIYIHKKITFIKINRRRRDPSQLKSLIPFQNSEKNGGKLSVTLSPFGRKYNNLIREKKMAFIES